VAGTLALVLMCGVLFAVLRARGHGHGSRDSSRPDANPWDTRAPRTPGSVSATGCSTWSATGSYTVGQVVTFRGRTYTAEIPHTLAVGIDWSPDATPQLWRAGGICTGGVAHGAPKFPPPPARWQEHWNEHTQNVRLIAYNDTVAIYFDDAVDVSSGKWMLPFLTRLWQYAQRTYGNGGNRIGERLHSISHTGRYRGGHPSTAYDASHDFRNVIDVGGDAWTKPQYDLLTHETGHIVEELATGRKGSPAYGLWKDSKWIEFYGFDAFVSLFGTTGPAQDAYNTLTAISDTFPRAGTHWFRDFFYPLWRDRGHAQVMVNFYKLIGAYFPTDGATYARGLNWGEFVHFMSGAAGTDLKPMATKAFGWPADWEAQYQRARVDFPQIRY
jgi:hypothetical protein